MSTPKLATEADVKLLMQTLARLESRVLRMLENQESFKGEIQRVAPRLDTRITEVHEAARLVHRQGNAVQAFALEAAEVSRALSLVEGRIRQVRDSIADELAPKEEPTTGTIKKEEGA